jgi:phosphate transport system substrate-binding protein
MLPKMSGWRFKVALAVCLWLLAGCGRVTITPPPPVFLQAAGSTSMGPLLAELAAAYNARQPNITFDIQGGGSQLGQRQVEAGQIDLGLVSWPPPRPAEVMQQAIIAHDGVAIIVHPQDPPAGLSLAELRDIFSGRLLEWAAVGGSAGEIQVVSREDGSGTRAAFETLVMEERAVTPVAIVLPNSRAVVDYVAQHPHTIAYVSLALVDERVRAIPVEGVMPGPDTLAAGSYPLIRDLAVVFPRRGAPEAARFVEFALSPAGQAIVGRHWGRLR